MEIKEIDLKDKKIILSKPRIVAEVSAGRCWYPDILKFSTGEFIITHSLNADTGVNLVEGQAVYLSTNGGNTFDYAYDVQYFHNGGGEPRISLPDGRIIGAGKAHKPDPPGQARNFVSHRLTYDKGGNRYTMEAWGVRVDGLPRDVDQFTDPEYWRAQWQRSHHDPKQDLPGISRTHMYCYNWFSDIVSLEDGAWISTISLRFKGDNLETTVAIRSEDEGRNWKYISTISPSGDKDIPYAEEGFDEPCLLHLGNNELLCISRVGSGKSQPLARTFSKDGGYTWSKREPMEVYSVSPQICKLQDGIFLLVTGRPGLFMWTADNIYSDKWAPVDLINHHNEYIEKWKMDTENISHIDGLSPMIGMTSSYAAIVEAGPNRAFIVYDRIPRQFGIKPVLSNSGERQQIWLVEVTVIKG